MITELEWEQGGWGRGGIFKSCEASLLAFWSMETQARGMPYILVKIDEGV